MARKTKCRKIHHQPEILRFKPAGIPLSNLDEVVLTFDEFEAIRLKDIEEMIQEDASKVMNVSQPTFHRLITSARKKVAEALVFGKSIRIEGGNYEMVKTPERLFKCFSCGNEWIEPYGIKRPQKCPNCGSENLHRYQDIFGFGRTFGKDTTKGHGNRHKGQRGPHNM